MPQAMNPGSLKQGPAVCLRRRWLFMSVFVLALNGCTREPTDLTLLQLARQQIAYDGRKVTTEGILRTHPSPRHYWIEDADLNRVELEHAAALQQWVGARVRVQGRFRYADDRGRRIEVEQIVALP